MKMPANIEVEMFAPCGMNCMVCYKHCTLKGKQKSCGGCLAADKDHPLHCRTCKIKDCVSLKGFTYCFECPDFPCKLINNLEKSYNQRYGVSLIENSKIAKEKGISHLMADHSQKYRCSDCGGVICLHDQECSDCGAHFKKE